MEKAKEDLSFWKSSGQAKILKRISSLTLSIVNSPFQGIGNPKPLKHDLKGCWSRRINQEHRFIYMINEEELVILSLKGHYED